MLDALGLPAGEADLYVTLIENPRSAAAELAVYTHASVQVISRNLARLAQRGLADRIPGRPPRYLAVAPDIALTTLIAKQEEQLRQAHADVDALMGTFRVATRQAHPAELIEIITGADNIRRRTAHLQEAARHQVRGFDRPPYVQRRVGNPREVERLVQGITYRVIYSRDAVMMTGRLTGDIRDTYRRGEQARVRPTLPLKVVIFDDDRALIPIRTSHRTIDAAFVVLPCDLLDALIALFESEWSRAIPLRPPHIGDEKQPAVLTDAETAVLCALAAGLTDDGIARALGCSLRTAQRHIQRIMKLTNSASRFQAGVAARERGWV